MGNTGRLLEVERQHVAGTYALAEQVLERRRATFHGAHQHVANLGKQHDDSGCEDLDRSVHDYHRLIVIARMDLDLVAAACLAPA